MKVPTMPIAHRRPLQGLLWLVTVGGIWVGFSSTAPAAPQQTGDAGRGATVFQQCYACHSVDPSEANLPGPNLAGVIGRTAGTLSTFPDYSEAMKAAGRRGLRWNTETLHAFLEDPERVVPGTSMTFVGLRSRQDRDDIIAFLERQTAALGPPRHRRNLGDEPAMRLWNDDRPVGGNPL